MTESLEQPISREEGFDFIRDQEESIARAIAAGKGNKDLAWDALEAVRLATEIVGQIIRENL